MATSKAAQDELSTSTLIPDATPVATSTSESVPQTPPRPQRRQLYPRPPLPTQMAMKAASREERVYLPNPSPEVLTTRSGRIAEPLERLIYSRTSNCVPYWVPCCFLSLACC